MALRPDPIRPDRFGIAPTPARQGGPWHGPPHGHVPDAAPGWSLPPDPPRPDRRPPGLVRLLDADEGADARDGADPPGPGRRRRGARERARGRAAGRGRRPPQPAPRA